MKLSSRRGVLGMLAVSGVLMSVAVVADEGVRDEGHQHPRIARAIHELEYAIHDLEGAPNDFGGFKAQAVADSKAAVASSLTAPQWTTTALGNARGRRIAKSSCAARSLRAGTPVPPRRRRPAGRRIRFTIWPGPFTVSTDAGGYPGAGPTRTKGADMIGYVTLGTNDMERAAKFYDALLGGFGAKRTWESDRYVAWGTAPTAPMLFVIKPYDGLAAKPGNGTMVSLAARSKAEVDSVYKKAIELGGKDEGPAGPRGDDFYAGYFRDLDGNKLAVFFIPQ